MSDNIDLYWTDNLNPPRHLNLSNNGGAQHDFPFPDLQDELEAEGIDINAIEIHQFSGTYTYGKGTSLHLLSTGGGAVFSSLELGSVVGFFGVEILFERAGMRSHVNYSVQAGIGGFGSIQTRGFAYEGCGFPTSSVNSEAFSFPGIRIIKDFSPSDSVGITARRTGNFVVYFPCNWHRSTSPRFRKVTIGGFVIISRPRQGRLAFKNDSRYKVDTLKRYPPEGSDTEGTLEDFLTPPEPVPSPKNPAKIESWIATSVDQEETNSTISLPEGITEGELLIIAISGYSRYDGTIDGWKRAVNGKSHNGAGGYGGLLSPTTQVFTRVATGDEGESVTINWEGPQSWAGWAFRISNSQGKLDFSDTNGGMQANNYVLNNTPPTPPPKVVMKDYPPLLHFQMAIIQNANTPNIDWGTSDNKYLDLEELGKEQVNGDRVFTAGISSCYVYQQEGPVSAMVSATTTFPDVPFGTYTKNNYGTASAIFTLYPKRE